MAGLKKEILENLKNTYCRIKKSKIDGVGVFAIRDIAKNSNPFYGVKNQRWQNFSRRELQILNKEVLTMISDFFAMDEDGKFSIPDFALNGINISFFLNTSSRPNVKTIDDGTNFVALKNIKKGEELTVSYSTYDQRYVKHGK